MFKKGKILLWHSHQEKGGRQCERNNSADTKVTAEGGRGGAWDARAGCFPLQLMTKTMVRQLIPLQSMVEQISTCSPWKELHARAGWCLKEAVTPWGAPCWSNLFLRDCTRGRDPRWGRSWRAAARGKDSRVRSLCRTLSRERDPRLEQGQRVRSPPLRRKERPSQRVMNWLQPPFPVPLHCSGRGGREYESEVEPGKKGVGGRRCFKIWIYFSLSYSDLVGDELNSLFSPSSVWFVRDSNWWVISPRPCLDPSIVFGAVLVGTWHLCRPNPNMGEPTKGSPPALACRTDHGLQRCPSARRHSRPAPLPEPPSTPSGAGRATTPPEARRRFSLLAAQVRISCSCSLATVTSALGKPAPEAAPTSTRAAGRQPNAHGAREGIPPLCRVAQTATQVLSCLPPRHQPPSGSQAFRHDGDGPEWAVITHKRGHLSFQWQVSLALQATCVLKHGSGNTPQLDGCHAGRRRAAGLSPRLPAESTLTRGQHGTGRTPARLPGVQTLARGLPERHDVGFGSPAAQTPPGFVFRRATRWPAGSSQAGVASPLAHRPCTKAAWAGGPQLWLGLVSGTPAVGCRERAVGCNARRESCRGLPAEGELGQRHQVLTEQHLKK